MHFNHGIGVNFVNIFPRTPSPILPLRSGEILEWDTVKLKIAWGVGGKRLAGGIGWIMLGCRNEQN